MDLNIFPNELLYQTALNLSPQQLFNFCLTSSQFQWICQDEIFWTNKVKLDYQYAYKPTDLTWHQFYKLLFIKHIKEIPLINQGQKIGFIWLRVGQHVKQILDQILSYSKNSPFLMSIYFKPVQHYLIYNKNTSAFLSIIGLNSLNWRYTTSIEINERTIY